jgi:hypothetical protein
VARPQLAPDQQHEAGVGGRIAAEPPGVGPARIGRRRVGVERDDGVDAAGREEQHGDRERRPRRPLLAQRDGAQDAQPGHRREPEGDQPVVEERRVRLSPEIETAVGEMHEHDRAEHRRQGDGGQPEGTGKPSRHRGRRRARMGTMHQ